MQLGTSMTTTTTIGDPPARGTLKDEGILAEKTNPRIG
jgi:hypothetical protein